MSDVGIGRTGGRAASPAGPFRAVTVVALIAVGVLTFAAMLVLGAFAPDLRSGRDGGAHALSNAAVGYSGLVQLARATGRNPMVIRNPESFDSQDLLILTPESGSVDLSDALAAHQGRLTLVVLPKWDTVADDDRRGWVRAQGLKDAFEPQGVLAPVDKLTVKRAPSGGRALAVSSDLPDTIRFNAPRPLQTITGDELRPLITDGKGGIVLGRLGTSQTFVLADPDLLDNRGIADESAAASALALLDWLGPADASSIGFDVTLNGFGRTRSPLKLLFTPPFLAMTLAIVAALLLAGWQAFARFGPARPRTRALAFGKAALVDNTALLVRKAGRESAVGSRYAAAIRERAATAFGVPARVRDAELDRHLDRLDGRPRFSTLAQAVADADTRPALTAAARALYDWKDHPL